MQKYRQLITIKNTDSNNDNIHFGHQMHQMWHLVHFLVQKLSFSPPTRM